MKGLIFTLALTYGGAVISLFSPYVGLLIYVAFAILAPPTLWYWSVPEGHYSRIVAVALLIGWLMQGMGNWEFGRAKAIVWSLISLLAWSALSAAALASNKGAAWAFVEDLSKIVLPFLVGITIIDTVAQLKQLAWVILLSEGYVAYELNLSFMGGVNRLYEEGFGYMDNNCNAIALVTCIGLAGFLGFASPRWWQKVIAFGAAALMGHAVLFSFSRGGMLALIITGCVAFYLIPKRPAHFVALFLAVAVMLRLAGAEVTERFVTTFNSADALDGSAGSRLVMWRGCIETMLYNPQGIGPANWGEIVERYGFRRGKQAHSLWLQIGAELGLPGLTMLVLFFGLTVKRLWPWTSEKTPVPDPWFRELSRMVIAAMIGFAVAAQFVSLSLLEHPYYITLIGAGLLKIGSKTAGQNPPRPVARYRRFGLGPMARRPVSAVPAIIPQNDVKPAIGG